MFFNILKSIMNYKEAYHLSIKKQLISASTYELIQAFEIPVSEFYNILMEFSELAMISNRKLYSSKRFTAMANRLDRSLYYSSMFISLSRALQCIQHCDHT